MLEWQTLVVTTSYKAYKRVKDLWRWGGPVIVFLAAGASIVLILLEVYAVVSVIILMEIILGFVLAYFRRGTNRRSMIVLLSFSQIRIFIPLVRGDFSNVLTMLSATSRGLSLRVTQSPGRSRVSQ